MEDFGFTAEHRTDPVTKLRRIQLEVRVLDGDDRSARTNP
jgi:hypothetical protein